MPFSSNVKLPRFMMPFSYANRGYASAQVNSSAKIDSVQRTIEGAIYHF